MTYDENNRRIKVVNEQIEDNKKHNFEHIYEYNPDGSIIREEIIIDGDYDVQASHFYNFAYYIEENHFFDPNYEDYIEMIFSDFTNQYGYADQEKNTWVKKYTYDEYGNCVREELYYNGVLSYTIEKEYGLFQ